jgi:hypothetical protein
MKDPPESYDDMVKSARELANIIEAVAEIQDASMSAVAAAMVMVIHRMEVSDNKKEKHLPHFATVLLRGTEWMEET